MKKILYFLCFLYFFTLSSHATLQVNFRVTGLETKNIKICVQNHHVFGKNVCSLNGTVTRYYKKKTKQIFFVEAQSKSRFRYKGFVWNNDCRSILHDDGQFVGRGGVIRGYSYDPKGNNGSITLEAKILLQDRKLHIYNCKIDDKSK